MVPGAGPIWRIIVSLSQSPKGSQLPFTTTARSSAILLISTTLSPACSHALIARPPPESLRTCSISATTAPSRCAGSSHYSSKAWGGKRSSVPCLGRRSMCRKPLPQSTNCKSSPDLLRIRRLRRGSRAFLPGSNPGTTSTKPAGRRVRSAPPRAVPRLCCRCGKNFAETLPGFAVPFRKLQLANRMVVGGAGVHLDPRQQDLHVQIMKIGRLPHDIGAREIVSALLQDLHQG